jgi:hypothetical protein
MFSLFASWNDQAQKATDVMRRSEENPAAGSVEKSWLTKAPRLESPDAKNCAKKKYGMRAPATARTR